MTKTIHSYRDYVFTIEFDTENPAYIVDFPDVRDIITSGSSLPEAFSHACEALDLYFESLERLGQKPPQPRHHLVMEPNSVA